MRAELGTILAAVACCAASAADLGMLRNDEWRSALCGTVIATRANVIASDWRIGPNDPEVLLTEFADEDNTLTYFRTPVIQNPLFVDDELLGGK